MIHVDQSSWLGVTMPAAPGARSIGSILGELREVAQLRERAREGMSFLNMPSQPKHPQAGAASALRRGIG